MARDPKPLAFLGSSQKDLRDMPVNARQALGPELMTVQFGGEPGDFKSMPVVGVGVHEIRYQDYGQWRISGDVCRQVCRCHLCPHAF